MLRELKEKREGKSAAEGIVDNETKVKGTTKTAQEEAQLLEEGEESREVQADWVHAGGRKDEVQKEEN